MLARAKDAAEPVLRWTAPGDGQYVLVLSDRNHQGGDDFVYRLEMKRAEPDFHAALDTSALRLELGKTAQFKVAVVREDGYAAPLAVVVSGLPDGITATTSGASATVSSFTVTLTAPATSDGFNGPLQVSVVSTDREHPDVRGARFDLGADALIRRIDHVWLTVSPSPPASAR